jgi:hypothetical protein
MTNVKLIIVVLSFLTAATPAGSAAIRQFARDKVAVSSWSSELTALINHPARVSGYLGPVGAVGRFQFRGNLEVINGILKAASALPQASHIVYLSPQVDLLPDAKKRAGDFDFEVSIAPGGEAFVHLPTIGVDFNALRVPKNMSVEMLPLAFVATDPVRQREANAEQERIERFIAERKTAQ